MEIVVLSYVEDEIDSFDDQTQAKILRLVGLLKSEQYHLCMPHSKMVGRGLYELRVLGKHNIRIFYCFSQEKIVLLHLVSKKTQKIAKKDMDVAKSRWRQLRI